MRYYLFIAILFIGASISEGYAQRIAYVDQNLAIKDAAILKKADAEMDKIVKGWRDTLGLLQKNYDVLYASFKKDSGSLSADSLRKRKTELINIQLQAKQYERLKLNNVNGGDYAAHRKRLLEPVGKRFREAVAEVAKSEKIDIVLTKDKIIVTSDAIDLTEKVAAKLK